MLFFGVQIKLWSVLPNNMKGNKMSFVLELEKCHMALQGCNRTWSMSNPHYGHTATMSISLSNIYNLQTYNMVKVRSDAPEREISCLCICTKLTHSQYYCPAHLAYYSKYIVILFGLVSFAFLPWVPSSLNEPLCGCIVLISQSSSCQTRTNVFWLEFGALTSICADWPDAGFFHWLLLCICATSDILFALHLSTPHH